MEKVPGHVSSHLDEMGKGVPKLPPGQDEVAGIKDRATGRRHSGCQAKEPLLLLPLAFRENNQDLPRQRPPSQSCGGQDSQQHTAEGSYRASPDPPRRRRRACRRSSPAPPACSGSKHYLTNSTDHKLQSTPQSTIKTTRRLLLLSL